MEAAKAVIFGWSGFCLFMLLIGRQSVNWAVLTLGCLILWGIVVVPVALIGLLATKRDSAAQPPAAPFAPPAAEPPSPAPRTFKL